jgi:lipid-binding SYLF domain-containing protein
MSPILRPLFATLIVTAVVFSAFVPRPGIASSAGEIDNNVDKAIADLYSQSSEAKALAVRAKGILVFPKIIKGGLIVGAQAGEGALRVNGKTAGYYNTVAVSYGLQAGVQWFGYAMYFMNDSALKYLDESDGWEVGVGPSIVVVEEGFASSATTTSLKDDIYVFFFKQKGLMAGLGIQGTKITKITPE